MQQRVRRSICQIFQVIRLCAFELIVGMKTRNLKTTCPAMCITKYIGEVEKLIVVLEAPQQIRDNEQSCFKNFRIRFVKSGNFDAKIVQ